MIIINHLTRMRRGFICVAGIDLETKQHIRPVVRRDQLSMRFLARYGGPFDVGYLVNLGRIIPQKNPPHTEDHIFDPSKVTLKRIFSPEEFWDTLVTVSKSYLIEIFGNELERVGRSKYGTNLGQGKSSLGCLIISSKPKNYISGQESERAQIRMRLTDGKLEVDAAVNDLRLYGDDLFSPHLVKIDEIKKQIDHSRGIILSVGLTRAFSSSPNLAPIHWLQINNIHLKENPIWQLS